MPNIRDLTVVKPEINNFESLWVGIVAAFDGVKWVSVGTAFGNSKEEVAELAIEKRDEHIRTAGNRPYEIFVSPIGEKLKKPEIVFESVARADKS
jgi:hypothetical protein